MKATKQGEPAAGHPTSAFSEYRNGEITSSEYFEKVRKEADEDVRREHDVHGEESTDSS